MPAHVSRLAMWHAIESAVDKWASWGALCLGMALTLVVILL